MMPTSLRSYLPRDGWLHFTLPMLRGHAMAVIE
jgi:hypothetical protein